ncbi:hypothetical protein D3C76_1579580 [compost metagenome]
MASSPKTHSTFTVPPVVIRPDFTGSVFFAALASCFANKQRFTYSGPISGMQAIGPNRRPGLRKPWLFPSLA